MICARFSVLSRFKLDIMLDRFMVVNPGANGYYQW
jgi:hypothetical protein